MIKRKIYLAIMVLILGMYSTNLTFAAAVNSDIQEQQLQSKIEKDVKIAVQNIETGTNVQMESDISDTVQTFLREKQNAYDYARKVNNYEKINFKLKVNLIETKMEKSQLILLYAVESEYQYKGDMSDEPSGECVEVQVAVDLEKKQIVDFYEKEDAFDEAVREIKPTSRIASIDVVTSKMPAEAVIIDQSQQFKKDVLKQRIEQENTEINVSASESVKAAKNYTWLSGTKIKNWARNNYNKAKPASGGKGVPYYDFSQISGNYDCTNFVSHALLAGGANIYKPNGVTGISSKGWYYTSTKNRSSSWSGVANLHSFLTSNKTKGPAGTSSVYSSKAGTKAVGDIIQCYNGSIWRHSTIVTALTKTSDGRNQAKVTGRTSKSKYNNNQLITEIYPNKAKRTISALRTY